MEALRPIFRFGPFESRPRTRELYKHGLKLKIRPQPLQLLNLLLGRAGQVVSRDEIRQQLWSSQTFVDFEHSVNTSVRELRAVLSDSAAGPRYIETLPRLGYRFITPVEVVEPPASPAPIPTAPGPDGLPGVMPQARPRRRVALAAICAVAIFALAGYFAWSRMHAGPHAPGKVMLAVLPFENLTGDAAQEYFSDGLTEEMITQLGRLDPPDLGIIARTSVMQYKHTQEQLDQIGRELGVQYVLEGSVRRGSGKVRVSAELIQTRNQTHVWAREYDRELSNVLGLQDEIAHEITDEIELTLGEHKPGATVEAAPLSSRSYEAYDLYLQGLYFWNKRTPDGLQQAATRFEQAIAKDPGYARAYAGLADTEALMSGYGVAPPDEVMPKARVAALKALDLDEKLAEAHVSLAVIAQNYDWDWQTAEKEYRRAIRLDSNYATAHHWYAENLALQGRFDEAFAEMNLARRLDPLSLIIAADNGAILYFSRQYDRAIEQLRAVLAMEPNFPRAHMLLYAFVEKGLYSEALADAGQVRRLGAARWGWADTAYICGRSGQPVRAEVALRKLQELSRTRALDPLPFVLAYIGMGRRDEAFAWLEKSVKVHSPSLTALKVDPIYDPLRSDPRFSALLYRIGLAQ